MWVNAMIPGGVGRRFGQRTSNAVESMNNSLKSIRSRGILDVLMGLWHQQMGQRYERLQVALSTKLAFPPTVHAFIRDEQQCARPYLVKMGPFNTAVVEPPAGLGRFVVDLQARVCTCQEFQMRNLPCSHALVTIDVAGKQVADYIPYHHTLTCWQDTYKYNMRPIVSRFPSLSISQNWKLRIRLMGKRLMSSRPSPQLQDSPQFTKSDQRHLKWLSLLIIVIHR